MLPNYTIGLNETKLGIVAPSWFIAAMRNVLPRRDAEKALTMGTMFTSDEALKVIFTAFPSKKSSIYYKNLIS
jgi:Delta3-Delta2-enoyl-CoA isomerase